MFAYVYAYVAILKRSCLLLCLKCVWKVLFSFPFSLKFTYKHIKFLSLILVFHSSFPPLFFAFLFFSFFSSFLLLLRIRFWFIVLVSFLSFFPRSFVEFRLLKCFAKETQRSSQSNFTTLSQSLLAEMMSNWTLKELANCKYATYSNVNT